MGRLLIETYGDSKHCGSRGTSYCVPFQEPQRNIPKDTIFQDFVKLSCFHHSMWLILFHSRVMPVCCGELVNCNFGKPSCVSFQSVHKFDTLPLRWRQPRFLKFVQASLFHSNVFNCLILTHFLEML
jgi:hypothetical protein